MFSMEKNNNTSWKDKVETLGFRRNQLGNTLQIRHYSPKHMAEFKQILGVPEGAFKSTDSNEMSETTKLFAMNLHDDKQKTVVRDRLIMPILLGKRSLITTNNNEDRESMDEFLNDFVQGMGVDAYAAQSLDITKDNPLIINSSTSVAIFDKITIKSGGYIEISVPCSFQCNTMEVKYDGTASPKEYHILVTGQAGKNGEDGSSRPADLGKTPPALSTAKNGANGVDGTEGKCDCCHGVPKEDGTVGGNGENGAAGVPGSDGVKGSNGPQVFISIGELINDLTIYNSGGKGGDGGKGESGGNGGNGGNGGASKTCCAFYTKGGDGGNGANGGNGASGGNGANSGNGGEVSVSYKSTVGAHINTHCLRGSGGKGGSGGLAGAGGRGGNSGGRGSKPGNNGQPGTNGQSGKDGLEGNIGEINVIKK